MIHLYVNQSESFKLNLDCTDGVIFDFAYCFCLHADVSVEVCLLKTFYWIH